jgi:hypothetical protein
MKLDRKKLVRYAVVLGVVLGLVCPSLPEKYRPICTAIASLASSC